MQLFYVLFKWRLAWNIIRSLLPTLIRNNKSVPGIGELVSCGFKKMVQGLQIGSEFADIKKLFPAKTKLVKKTLP